MSRRKALRRLHIGARLPPRQRRFPPLGRRDAERAADMASVFMFLWDLCEDWCIAEAEDVPLVLARARWIARIPLPRTQEEFWSGPPLLEAERSGEAPATGAGGPKPGERPSLAA